MSHDVKLDSGTPAAVSSLPLAGEKTGYYKSIAVLVLIACIMLANYFVIHKDKQDSGESTEESYNLNSNPITKTAMPALTTGVNKLTIDENSQLRQKIAEAKAQDFIDRMQATQTVGTSIGSNSQSAFLSNGSQTTATEHANRSNDAVVSTLPTDPNTAFLIRAGNSKAQREYATHFGPLPYVIGQGKFIFGILAVAINSDIPGQIEAVVSEDIYGEQGSKVLIPRGSHLIGEYRSGLVNNQSRLFTVWTRIKEPNGIDIQLGSEGTDGLGRAGLTGSVDYHFIDRFGGAVLVSLIGAGAATVGVNSSDQFNSSSAYRSGIAEAMSEQGKSMLSQNINIPPTINIAQGQKIVVFVNRDLDFSRVYR